MSNLLHVYAERQRRARPTSGITVPVALSRSLAINGNAVCDDTVADGNCGVHAFGLSLHAEAQRNLALRNTAQYKAVSRKMSDTPELIAHLRGKAYSWMVSNADSLVWDGMLYRGRRKRW